MGTIIAATMGTTEWIAILSVVVTIGGGIIAWMSAIYKSLATLRDVVTTLAGRLEAVLQRMDTSDDDRHHLWEKLATQEKTIGDLRVEIARFKQC